MPRLPRPRAAKGYYKNNKRCSFGHGGLGSNINREGKWPRLGHVNVNGYDQGFDNWRSNCMGNNLNQYEGCSNNWLVPNKVRSKKLSHVLPVVCGGDNTTVMIRNIPNKYKYVLGSFH